MAHAIPVVPSEAQGLNPANSRQASLKGTYLTQVQFANGACVFGLGVGFTLG